jgi:putative resolvase
MRQFSHDKRADQLQCILSDPSATVVVVEHRDRLARLGVEHRDAALSAKGRHVMVTEPGETADNLVRDMIEVLASVCARRYGHRGVRDRAVRAIAAIRITDPAAEIV